MNNVKAVTSQFGLGQYNQQKRYRMDLPYMWQKQLSR